MLGPTCTLRFYLEIPLVSNLEHNLLNVHIKIRKDPVLEEAESTWRVSETEIGYNEYLLRKKYRKGDCFVQWTHEDKKCILWPRYKTRNCPRLYTGRIIPKQCVKKGLDRIRTTRIFYFYGRIYDRIQNRTSCRSRLLSMFKAYQQEYLIGER